MGSRGHARDEHWLERYCRLGGFGHWSIFNVLRSLCDKDVCECCDDLDNVAKKDTKHMYIVHIYLAKAQLHRYIRSLSETIVTAKDFSRSDHVQLSQFLLVSMSYDRSNSTQMRCRIYLKTYCIRYLKAKEKWKKRKQ